MRKIGWLALGAAAGAAALAVAAGSNGGNEARIAIQRLPDGGNEVALQERDPDGGWGELRTPEKSYQSADAEAGRWLYSSPLQIGASGREPLRIGFLGIFSTPLSETFGLETSLGVELAIRHVNAAGGVFGMPVEMATADTGANPETAVASARRLIEERGVHAVVGPMFSQSAIAVGTQVAPYYGVPFISPLAGSPELAEIDDDGYFFRTYISDAAQVDVLAQLAGEEGIDEAAVVYRDTAWGRAFHRHFINHYHGEAASVGVQPARDSYAEELREAAAGGARALVLLASQGDLMQLVRDSVELDLFDRFLFHRAGRWQELYDAFPEALEGQLGTFYAGRHVTESEGHWEADFFEAFGHHPISHVTREAYDAALAIMLAAERAGTSEGTALRNALPAIAGPPGERHPASGAGAAAALAAVRAGREIDLDGEATALDWDANGDVVRGHITIWRFAGGEIEDLRHVEIDLAAE